MLSIAGCEKIRKVPSKNSRGRGATPHGRVGKTRTYPTQWKIAPGPRWSSTDKNEAIARIRTINNAVDIERAAVERVVTTAA